ncbi:dicer-like, partial [Thraustotheca clavata]
APVIHETYPPNSDFALDQLSTRVTELLNELDALQVFEYLLKKGFFGCKKHEEKLAARVAKFLSDCIGVYQNLGTWCLYRFVYLELEKQARRASLKWTTAGNMTGLDPKAIYAMLLCVSKRNETQFGCTPKVEKIVEIIQQRLFGGSVPLEDNEMQDDDDGEIIPCDDDDEDGTTDKDALEEDESDDPVECFSDVSDVSDDEVFDVLEEEKTKAKADELLKCVIFVNRRAECRVLADFLNERFPTRIDDDGNEVKLFGCMLGQASASDAASYDLPDMQKTLESFESGQARVMVSTSVSCEGVDFPLCSMVICADTIQCPRKFIQVRGRARHTDGVCFYLTNASAIEDGKQFHVLSRQAEEIGRLEFKCDKKMTTKQQPLSIIALKNQFHYTITHLENNPTIPAMLKVNSTGAILDLDSSISCLNMFCQSLPFFQKYNLNPVFEYEHKIEDKKNYFKVKLTLPSDLEIEPIITPFMSSKMNSKAVAAFWACETLYRLGKLDDNLNSVYRQKKHRNLVQLQERAGDYQASKRFKKVR